MQHLTPAHIVWPTGGVHRLRGSFLRHILYSCLRQVCCQLLATLMGAYLPHMPQLWLEASIQGPTKCKGNP